MLNTVPLSIPPPLPASRIIPPRRGAQPSNRNALKHGLYAIKTPAPFPTFLSAITLDSLGYDPAACAQAIQAAREHLLDYLLAKPGSADFRTLLSWQRPIPKSLQAIERLGIASYRRKLSGLHLKIAAAYPMKLIRYGFRSVGITRDADLPGLSQEPGLLPSQYSFREKDEKRHLYSTASRKPFFPDISEPPVTFHFLAPEQWAILDPLLPSPNVYFHLGKGRGRGRGRPPADPHALLDAIFWKFAHHARWQDLPPGSPPMLTCRRYYRRLFLSGRLATLYAGLYKDFLARADLDVTALVDQGGIIGTGRQVIWNYDQPETWQTRTVLLFIQQGYQNFRRLLRDKDQELYSGHYSYCLPSLDPGLPFSSSIVHPQPSLVRSDHQTDDYQTPLFVPRKNKKSDLNSALARFPVRSSSEMFLNSSKNGELNSS